MASCDDGGTRGELDACDKLDFGASGGVEADADGAWGGVGACGDGANAIGDTGAARIAAATRNVAAATAAGAPAS